jgi:phage recombination protein Bet
MTTALEPSRGVPEPWARRNVSETQWRVMFNLFPGANPNSVLMAWDYCVARRLDPLKKPCHIVEINGRDVVLPGIYELRTTAHRTGVYLGHSLPAYGPEEPCAGVTAPAWCEMTMYRWNPDAKLRIEFPVRAWFREVVAVGKDSKANARWRKAPRQMLTKCTEAAGLREAFPDELGGEHTAEELDGQRAIDVATVDAAPPPPAPEGFDDWLANLTAVADESLERLEDTFAKSPEPFRKHLTGAQADTWEELKARALPKDVPF